MPPLIDQYVNLVQRTADQLEAVRRKYFDTVRKGNRGGKVRCLHETGLALPSQRKAVTGVPGRAGRSAARRHGPGFGKAVDLQKVGLETTLDRSSDLQRKWCCRRNDRVE